MVVILAASFIVRHVSWLQNFVLIWDVSMPSENNFNVGINLIITISLYQSRITMVWSDATDANTIAENR